jgi:hypothetical protein
MTHWRRQHHSPASQWQPEVNDVLPSSNSVQLQFALSLQAKTIVVTHGIQKYRLTCTHISSSPGKVVVPK